MQKIYRNSWGWSCTRPPQFYNNLSPPEAVGFVPIMVPAVRPKGKQMMNYLVVVEMPEPGITP